MGRFVLDDVSDLVPVHVEAAHDTVPGGDVDPPAHFVSGDGGDLRSELFLPDLDGTGCRGEEDESEQEQGEALHAVLLWACTRYQNVRERKNAAGSHSWMVYR